MIGLSGAHRSGKSTLAKAWAKKYKGVYVRTTATEVYARLGRDPAATYDFKTRLEIQEEILKEFDSIYSKHSFDENAIADRTPLDLMSYTIAEAIGDRVPTAEQERLERYINRCFEVANKRFSSIIIVQPGIEVTPEPGKAALNKAYMEHLNTLLLGLTVDSRLTTQHFYIPKTRLDLEDRIKSVDFVVGNVKRVASADVEGAKASGALIH